MRRVGFIIISICLAAFVAAAQSSDANFPTQLRTNTVNGSIKPRALGDSRLTTYYYAFNGDQGDIFVSVITKNFDGDIDVFAVSGMRQLTKLVVYSDGNVNETGRLIYLRKPEKLLLRVQGRPPGDTDATFQIKFGGSFLASTDADSEAAPTVAVVPEKMPEPKVDPVKAPEKETEVATVEKKPETKPERKPKVETPKEKTPTFEKVVPEKKEVAKKPEAKAKPSASSAKKAEPPAKPTPDPLAKYNLVIQFKDGKKLDKPMTEVERVTVEGVNLVVILKSGVITTYSLLTVEKFTID